MRKLILLATLALVVPSSASAATPCTAKGAKTVAQNATARVFYVAGKGEVKRIYYGCRLSDKPVRFASDVSPKADDETHTTNSGFKLAGRYVAWFQESFSDFGVGEFGRSVNVRALTKGDRKFSADIGDQGDPRALAVRDDGAAAWVLGAPKVDDYREIDAVAPTATGAAPLAFATGIDASMFAIDADGVHWTQDGKAHTAQPVAPPAEPKYDVASPGPETLDPSQGSCGALQPAPASVRRASADAIARGSDATVAVAGVDSIFSDAKGILVDKLTTAGAQDPAWNGGVAKLAKLPLPAGARNLTVGGVGVQPDGRVVVAAYYNTRDLTGEKVVLARFNTDGSLDGGFGSGGFRADALPAVTAATIDDIAIAPDGSIAAAATVDDTPAQNGVVTGEGDRFTVARFKPDGTLDTGFAGDGTVTLATNALGASSASAVRVLDGGRIVAAGVAGDNFALTRILADGTPDPGFGSNGATYASPPAAGGIKAFDFLADGRIVAVGDASGILGRDALSIARYSADGAPDESFGTGGSLIDPFGGAPRGVIAQPDGTLVVAGTSRLSKTFGSGLLRYRADGSRDAGFGTGGSLAGFTSFGLNVNGIITGAGGTILAAEQVSDQFSIASYAIDQPAIDAAATGARACSLSIPTKSLTQLLKAGKAAKHGKLRLAFFTIQPGPLRLKATASVGGKTITIGSVTYTSGSYGVGIAEIKVSAKAAAALKKAKSAPITVTATGARGPSRVTTKTLKR